MNVNKSEMLASRLDLGLRAIQDHFLDVSVLVLRYLVLILVLNGGLGSCHTGIMVMMTTT